MHGAGTLTARYVHGSNAKADDPLLWYDGATKRWLHANHQGSIVAVTNPNAAPAINSYDEYGIPGSTNAGRFQYTGQAWIPELGMYHYKARIYSPTLGRFLQTDPIGYDDQFNLYAYVGNDPVNNVDPSGKSCVPAGSNGQFQCKVDKTNDLEKTEAGAAKLQRIDSAYTSAVNKLMANPEKTRTIATDRTGTRIPLTKTVTQGEIGTALIAATVSYSPKPHDDPYYRAEAGGVPGSKEHPFEITLYPWGANKSPLEIQRTFVHEGTHGTAPDIELRRIAGRDFTAGHWPHYKRMVQEVIPNE